MTISTLVDSNIFIDILTFGRHADWSLSRLEQCMSEGALVLSPIVWAELVQPGIQERELERRLNFLRLQREPFGFEAAWHAGQAHIAYRKAGGARERTLPDFLIGAHAYVMGHRLLTRDGRRYRQYFPGLDLIAPDEGEPA